MSDDRPMSDAETNLTRGEYTLAEVVRILKEGGRTQTIRELRAACASGALVNRQVRGITMVSHDAIMDYLSGPVLAPRPNSPAAPLNPSLNAESLARAQAALSQLKSRIESERARREDDGEASVEIEEIGENLGEVARVAPQEVTDSQDEQELGSDADSAVLDERTVDDAPEEGPRGLPEPESVLGETDAPEDLIEVLDMGQGVHACCNLEILDDGTRQRHGVYMSWFANEQQATEGVYAHGVLEGPWKQWHANGQVQSIGAYAAGLQTGPWTIWDDVGRKLQEGSYKDGVAIGTWREFHGNGALWRECHFESGVLVGTQRYFDASGILISDSQPS